MYLKSMELHQMLTMKCYLSKTAFVQFVEDIRTEIKKDYVLTMTMSLEM